MKIALITNPNSGWNKKHKDDVSAALAKHDPDGHITHYQTPSVELLEEALMQCADNNIDFLIINGGDGTIDDVVTLIRTRNIFTKKDPAYAFLPGGTTNMTHQAMRKGRHVIGGLRAILNDIYSDVDIRSRLADRALLKLDIKDHGRVLYGFFFGAAAIPKLISYARNKLHKRGLSGKLGHLIMFFTLIVKLVRGSVYNDPLLHPKEIQYGFEAYKWRDSDAVLLYVTSLPRLLLGLKTGVDNNHYCLGGLGVPYRKLLRSLPLFWRGKTPQDGSSAFFSFLFKRGMTMGMKLRGSFTLDGALYEYDGQTELVISLAPPLSVYDFGAKS